MPEPLGEPVSTSTFVDAAHASNVVTRRSSTCNLFSCNGPIKAFSKQHNTVKSSTFVSELVALCITRNLILELRTKLKSIGVPLKGPTDIYCNNQGVVKNTSIIKYKLNNKHNSTNYHFLTKEAAAGILRVGKEDTANNLDDLLTKLMPN